MKGLLVSGVIQEIDREMAKSKPVSSVRLMWQGIKAMFASSGEKYALADKRISELEQRFVRVERAVETMR